MFERSVPNLVSNEGLIEKDSLSTLQMILVKYCNVLRVRSQGKTARRIRERWKKKKNNDEATQLRSGDESCRELESQKCSDDCLVRWFLMVFDGFPYFLCDVVSESRIETTLVS